MTLSVIQKTSPTISHTPDSSQHPQLHYLSCAASQPDPMRLGPGHESGRNGSWSQIYMTSGKLHIFLEPPLCHLENVGGTAALPIALGYSEEQ